MSYDPNNIFAMILRGEAPCHKVYEDDHSLAFMDVMPQVDGHTLVIPKDSAQDMLSADPEILGRTIQTTQRVATAVKAAFGADGIMIAQLNGAAAGQTVFHLHFHIMPRNDGVDFKMHARDMADPELLAAHAERVRSALAG
jgi:histidine triad (HIT) family protein